MKQQPMNDSDRLVALIAAKERADALFAAIEAQA
jgi:hypothetical protein